MEKLEHRQRSATCKSESPSSERQQLEPPGRKDDHACCSASEQETICFWGFQGFLAQFCFSDILMTSNLFVSLRFIPSIVHFETFQKFRIHVFWVLNFRIEMSNKWEFHADYAIIFVIRILSWDVFWIQNPIGLSRNAMLVQNFTLNNSEDWVIQNWEFWRKKGPKHIFPHFFFLFSLEFQFKISK